MNNLICQAIKEMRKVRISYKGGTRVIEPHAFGYDTQRKRKLRAYQVSGYSESRNTQGWKLLDVDEITNFQLLDDYFHQPRQGYNPKADKAIPNIICKI